MADTISGGQRHQQNVQHVLYVPSRHATAIDLRLPSAAYSTPCHSLRPSELPTSPHRRPSTIFNPNVSTSISSGGARSAFTAVHPRFHRFWSLHHSLASHQHPHQHEQQQEQHQHQQRLSSIQQSYSKLFARNELLKLLVSKQLKSLYSTHPPQLSPPPPTASLPPSPQKYANSPAAVEGRDAMDECQPSTTVAANRLLELSSVIKAINTARLNSTAREERSLGGQGTNGFGNELIRPPSGGDGSDRNSFRRSDSTGSNAHIVDGGVQPNVGSSGMIFRCDWNGCYRTFDTAEQWTIHVTHTHVIADSEDSLYYCQWKDCARRNNGFNARYKMLIHVRSHTNDKPYRCPHCAKAFLRSETLRIHKRIHSSEKLFACKYLGCNKRYTDPSSLRKHVKTKNHIVIEV